MTTNVLYYGDNLDILRRYIPDASVDLVYLDPPFNSNRDYNVIFKDESGRKSDAQMLAFEDTWHWGPDAEAQYAFLTNAASNQGRVASTVSTIIAALRAGIGENQMMAYLVEMAVRLVELHRVLKPTGSLYLHCDPTASHYLKVLLDAIFDARNFRNEIIWKRSSAHSDSRQGARYFGRVSDTLLFYAKDEQNVFNQQHGPYDETYLAENYNRHDPDGRVYRIDNTQGPGGESKGNPRYEFLGVTRYWRYSRERMQQLYDEGRIIQTRPGAVPQYKRYLDEMPGLPAQSVWSDIPVINNRSKELLGYPTQKPVALLERIIATSSNPGDIVLDPFCGCGTALVAAQKLGRRWIGIDITYLSIAVMKARLKDSFGLPDVEVIGQPTEVDGARLLLKGAGLEGQYQFQWWALDLIGAQPQGGTLKKGADKGIDGVISFSTGPRGEVGRALVSVKSGGVNSSMIRDLKGVLDREKAEIGLFVTLDEPSAPMRLEASTAGVYHSDLSGRDYQRTRSSRSPSFWKSVAGRTSRSWSCRPTSTPSGSRRRRRSRPSCSAGELSEGVKAGQRRDDAAPSRWEHGVDYCPGHGPQTRRRPRPSSGVIPGWIFLWARAAGMSRVASYATIVESVSTDISSGDITVRSVLTSTP